LAEEEAIMHYGLIKQLETGHTCLVIGIFSNEPLSEPAEKLNQASNGLIQQLANKLKETGENRWQNDFQGHDLLLIHCGKRAEFNNIALQKCLTAILSQLLKYNSQSATLCLPPIMDENADSQLEQMLLQIDYELYQCLDFKTKKNKPHALTTLDFYLPEATKEGLNIALAVAEGINLTRNLANLPANICTPTYLSEQAHILSKEHKKITTTVFEREEMKTMGMGSLLAVAQGSIEPPKLVELKFLNGGDKPTIVLVGKGITFDSGGISLKPGNGMEEMKYDMAGAASVLGALKACALLDLPINLVGLLACAENMPSGSAVKPGDIVTSMSGQTIEIVNTDAEGRLVLADALTYAERFNPQFVIDIATLTGAVIVALGHVNTGFMTKDEQLADCILKASKASFDKVWRLPLEEAYEDALESTMADMVNATYDRTAGSVTAACFLARFTEKYPWAHLDVAGTAWISGKKRTATGRPVPLLLQLLRQTVHAH
jgi:leucyl aminopeptidase